MRRRLQCSLVFGGGLRVNLGSLAVLALAGASWLLGCGAPERDLPWQRVDLVSLPFEIEVSSGRAREVIAARAPRAPGRPVPGLGWDHPEVLTLRQAMGSTLSWRLALGSVPYLALEPLGAQRSGCRGTQRVAVRDAEGKTTDLLLEPLRHGGLFAPAYRELDLSEWARQSIELLFEVREDAVRGSTRRWRACRAVWGGPAVFTREDAGRQPDLGRPSVVLIGLDTFRADHWTSRPAGAPSMTPALDRLAAESDVWTRAYSALNNTNPSFISIHTGLYARDHGIYDLVTPLPDAHRTLAERFRDAGYRTGANLSARHLMPEASGLGQGFDELMGPIGATAAASFVVDRSIDWIARTRGPFFLWVHLFDAHTPTLPPEPFASGLRAAAPSGLSPTGGWTAFRPPGPREFTEPWLGGHPDLYGGEVAYLDRQIDRLLGYLEGGGLLAETFVVVVADHGESLGEHDLLHRHFGLYEASVHVPLVVRWPDSMTARGLAPGDARGRRFEGLVQTVDLAPSLLNAAGLEDVSETSDGGGGLDLWELALGSGASGGAGRQTVFTEHSNREGAMVRTPRHKYIVMEENRFLPAGPYLFDLETDPQELRNLAGSGLEIEQLMAATLHAWRKRSIEAEAARLPTEAEARSLRALGYLP